MFWPYDSLGNSQCPAFIIEKKTNLLYIINIIANNTNCILNELTNSKKRDTGCSLSTK